MFAQVTARNVGGVFPDTLIWMR